MDLQATRVECSTLVEELEAELQRTTPLFDAACDEAASEYWRGYRDALRRIRSHRSRSSTAPKTCREDSVDLHRIVRDLAARWEREAKNVRTGESYDIGQADGLERCVNDLRAVIGSSSNALISGCEPDAK